jgi:predicted alpha/beta superfamily hydrolase
VLVNLIGGLGILQKNKCFRIIISMSPSEEWHGLMVRCWISYIRF